MKNETAAKYRLHWGLGYVPQPVDEIHDQDHIESSGHYEPTEQRRIARLKVGETWTVNDVRTVKHATGAKLIHSVTRLS